MEPGTQDGVRGMDGQPRRQEEEETAHSRASLPMLPRLAIGKQKPPAREDLHLTRGTPDGMRAGDAVVRRRVVSRPSSLP